MADQYDVVVVGGGPSGSTAATLLAKHGRRVLLLEKERFPRFHIGESLMTETYWTFQRLDMLPKLAASDFPRKYSVQFANSSGRESHPFYFNQVNPHESSVTWQVQRDRFDKMMLENAAEHGVEVRQGVRVRDVMAEGDRVTGVITAGGDQSGAEMIPAPVVVDATGQGALLGRRFNIRKPDPGLRKAAIFAHYKGGHRDPGIDEGATLVLRIGDEEGWFWYIPLPDDIVSVGVVAGPNYLFGNRAADPAAVLDEEIAACVSVRKRLTKAQRVSPVRVCSDYTYHSTRCAGDGWVTVGDAFAFLDPIYSSGVLLALKSGEMAADAIHEALEAGDLSGRRLGQWGPRFSAGMEAMRKLVYAYYTPSFSFGQFVRAHPDQAANLVYLLMGDMLRPGVNDVFDYLARYCKLPEPCYALDGPQGVAA